MWKCKHGKKSFVTVAQGTEGRSQIYSCQCCGMLIAETIEAGELETYRQEEEVQA